MLLYDGLRCLFLLIWYYDPILRVFDHIFKQCLLCSLNLYACVIYFWCSQRFPTYYIKKFPFFFWFWFGSFWFCLLLFLNIIVLNSCWWFENSCYGRWLRLLLLWWRNHCPSHLSLHFRRRRLRSRHNYFFSNIWWYSWRYPGRCIRRRTLYSHNYFWRLYLQIWWILLFDLLLPLLIHPILMRIQHRYLNVLDIALPSILCFRALSTTANDILLAFQSHIFNALILLNCTLLGHGERYHFLGAIIISLLLFTLWLLGYYQILLFFQWQLLILLILNLNFVSLIRTLQNLRWFVGFPFTFSWNLFIFLIFILIFVFDLSLDLRGRRCHLILILDLGHFLASSTEVPDYDKVELAVLWIQLFLYLLLMMLLVVQHLKVSLVLNILSDVRPRASRHNLLHFERTYFGGCHLRRDLQSQSIAVFASAPVHSIIPVLLAK